MLWCMCFGNRHTNSDNVAENQGPLFPIVDSNAPWSSSIFCKCTLDCHIISNAIDVKLNGTEARKRKRLDKLYSCHLLAIFHLPIPPLYLLKTRGLWKRIKLVPQRNKRRAFNERKIDEMKNRTCQQINTAAKQYAEKCTVDVIMLHCAAYHQKPLKSIEQKTPLVIEYPKNNEYHATMLTKKKKRKYARFSCGPLGSAHSNYLPSNMKKTRDKLKYVLHLSNNNDFHRSQLIV